MPRRDAPETPDGSNVSADPHVEPAKSQRYLRHDEYIKTDVGRIIMIDNDDDSVNEIAKILAKKRENELDITQSKVGGYILSDRVFAVEKRRGDYNNVVVVHGKTIKVIIPGNMFFPQEYTVERCNRELDRRIGSKIDYIVKSYDKNNDGDIVIAVASRADAMRAKSATWFTGANGDAPKLLVGDVVQARVVAEMDYGFIAETGGVETLVKYAPGAEHVARGSHTLLRITNIQKTESGEVSFRAESFNATGSGFGSSHDDFATNSKYYGIVSGVTNDGLFVDLGSGVSCYCRFTSKDRPTIGQSVSVTITGQAQKDFLFARVNHIG